MFRKGRDQEIFENRSRKQSRFWILAVALLFFGALFIAIIYFLVYSNFFKIKKITVANPTALSSAAIINALKAQIISRGVIYGVLSDDNILFWALGKKEEFIENLPVVAKLHLKTIFASREVVIETEERNMFGVWCPKPQSSEEACYAFDNDGIIFSNLPQLEGMLILKIEDQNNRVPVLGKSFLKPEWFKNIITAYNILEKKGWSVKQLVIRDLSLKEWEAKLVAGPTLYFSFNFIPADFEKLTARLSEKINLAGLKYLDFRVPSRIYYK
jgi:hypothetical protein